MSWSAKPGAFSNAMRSLDRSAEAGSGARCLHAVRLRGDQVQPPHGPHAYGPRRSVVEDAERRGHKPSRARSVRAKSRSTGLGSYLVVRRRSVASYPARRSSVAPRRWNRAALYGATSISGGCPRTRRETIFPLGGPPVMPKCPWPRARYRPGRPGASPKMGRLSGVDGR